MIKRDKMTFSINKNCEKLINNLISNSEKYRIKIVDGPLGCKFIDAGINAIGSIESGIKISEICLGDLGNVTVVPSNFSSKINWSVNVTSSNPVLACLGCQYAGWSLNHKNFFSLGSGPARSIAQREDIFKKIKYKDFFNRTCLVLEVDKAPPKEIIEKVSYDCKLDPKNLFFILTPTTSMSGNLQIVSRILEVAIHKCHELNFPLDRIVDGIGTTPIPPVAKNFLDGMGRTNDSIIYGGTVFLTIKGDIEDIKELSKNLPSLNSRDYGKPFKSIFNAYGGDFYKIDGSLFSPAKVIINALKTGETFISGKINNNLVEQSFF